MRPLVRGVGVVVLLAWPTVAAAEPSAADRAAVLALYHDAKALLDEGRVAEACAKLEEARRLDPAALGARLKLAECYRAGGRVASAWAEYFEAAMVAQRLGDPRLEEALGRARALEPTVPRLRVTVEPAADVPGLEVRRDGVPLGRPQLGTAVPVDAGAHVVRVSAPGRRTVEVAVEVAPGGATSSVAVPLLAPIPAGGPADMRALPRPSGALRPAGWAVGGIGLASLAVGLGLGARYLAKVVAAADHCDAEDTCDDAGLSLRRQAIDVRVPAIVSLGLGVLATAGGVVMLHLGGAGGEPAAGVGLGPGWIALGGRF